PATVGAVVPAGQELFRLIRDGRLEWRAAVAESDIGKLVPGQVAEIRVAGQAPLRGRLRSLSPAIDTATHSGLAYVDLPRGTAIRAGAFARGHVEIGETVSLTLPQSAVALRDGFHYVMRVGPASTVVATRVSVGSRIGDRIAITAGLAENDAVVAAGVGFLSDGDAVRVVGGPAAGAGTTAGSGP
ncbi:efflux RND transporter periplasmic adaptor subunit, partial [Tahibacter caeni]|uniref:efflux RND transporter periplasmic adaptor subunit n=1 Tax=Tahibacter caeni TaxID=1453545 RepID=UPI0021474C62